MYLRTGVYIRRVNKAVTLGPLFSVTPVGPLFES